jgi:hypothetical protein
MMKSYSESIDARLVVSVTGSKGQLYGRECYCKMRGDISGVCIPDPLLAEIGRACLDNDNTFNQTIPITNDDRGRPCPCYTENVNPGPDSLLVTWRDLVES